MSKRPIAFNRDKLAILKAAYDLAKKSNLDLFTVTFEPEGECEFVIGYAKYVIEYLEGEFAVPDQCARPYNEGEEGQ